MATDAVVSQPWRRPAVGSLSPVALQGGRACLVRRLPLMASRSDTRVREDCNRLWCHLFGRGTLVSLAERAAWMAGRSCDPGTGSWSSSKNIDSDLMLIDEELAIINNLCTADWWQVEEAES